MSYFDARYAAHHGLRAEPCAGLGHVEYLALVHQRQHQRIGDAVMPAVRALALFPTPVANDALRGPCADQATHAMLLFVIIQALN
jgi:hypothetical protein